MVDALKRAHRMVSLDGCIVDIHPTEAPASVRVGTLTVGLVDGGDATIRHKAAGNALATVVDAGLLAVADVVDFDFYTYADTIEELRDYIARNWRNARIDEETVAAARTVIRDAPAGVRPCTLEHVRLTTLRTRPRW
jgi:hypothetical protein